MEKRNKSNGLATKILLVGALALTTAAGCASRDNLKCKDSEYQTKKPCEQDRDYNQKTDFSNDRSPMWGMGFGS
jgi:hypothetical protein